MPSTWTSEGGGRISFSGVPGAPSETANLEWVISSQMILPTANSCQALPRPPPQPRRMLELFCGKGHLGSIFRSLGFEVVSVDIDPEKHPTLQADIQSWQYWKSFPPLYFDVVACHPPFNTRDLPKADALIKTTLDIIDYLQPTLWFIVNSRTGELSKRPFMQGITHIDIDHCQFSDEGFQNPTRIWGSRRLTRLENCLCDGWCASMAWNDHKGTWTHRSHIKNKRKHGKPALTTAHTCAIPPGLVQYLLRVEPSLILPLPCADDSHSTSHSSSV